MLGAVIDGMKTCSDCNEWKTIDNFIKTDRTNCGLHSFCKECISWRNKIKRRIDKMEFVLVYGNNGGCTCCGEKELDLLTIEHIRDGKHKLLEGFSGGELIIKLRTLGWPDGYTCLCWNCNCSQKQGISCSHNEEGYKKYLIQLEENIKSDIIRDKYFKLKQQLNTI